MVMNKISSCLTLPKSARLKKRRDIKEVFEKGTFVGGALLKIGILKTQFKHSRLSICIPKRTTKKSTLRNRLKRLIREIFRVNRKNIKEGLDIVVIIKDRRLNKKEDLPSTSLKYDILKSEILQLLSKAGCLR
ncbi:MAG: ribonuclease P protein component [Candidatus Omnitrophica bacterium]|nr:ribonuclease P protein component [Candidatus Omnitrophota bacterium]